MNKLILTVGLPRIGKTTWVKDKMKEGIPVVNPDSIRLAIHGQPFIAEAEPYVWATAKTMTHSLFLAGHDIVVIDATNTTKARRKFWESKHWNRTYNIFGGPEDKNLCIERAKKTTHPLHLSGLTAAIIDMANKWEDVEDHEIDVSC